MKTVEEISQYCNGELVGNMHLSSIVIQQIYIDSRAIFQPHATMFVALKTDRRNGHDFIESAYQKGVRIFLVQKEYLISNSLSDAIFIKIDDTLQGLQLIATKIRETCNYPVIGITGSNGKTIVKDWLLQLFPNNFQIIASPKSFNSQIGVPLSVWKMEPNYNLGIFEAGISEAGEMEILEKMIQPTCGIFTNIGEAHSSGFLNIRQKINEKLKLFIGCQSIVYCKDNYDINEAISLFSQTIKHNTGREIQFINWSYKQDAVLRIITITKEDNKCIINASYRGEQVQIQIPFTDAASIENAIHCWCTLLHFNIPSSHIENAMASLTPIAMRLELKQGEDNSVVINDSYNANFNTLPVAIEMLESQKLSNGKTIILSDLYQTDRNELVMYTELGELLNNTRLDRFVGIGPKMKNYAGNIVAKAPKIDCYFYESTNDFLDAFNEFDFADQAILLKGSRTFEFEKISLMLDQKIHQTIMTVNLTALRQNLGAYRRRIQPNTKIMAMVKASSYGSGNHEIAAVLQEELVDYLTVAYIDEGVALRKAKIHLPIMVMSPATQSFDRMISWNLEPEIFNIRSLKLFLAAAAKWKTKAYPIHIKLDTGMHRLGFMEDELLEAIQLLKYNQHVTIKSIFSHLVASDDATFNDFTHHQAKRFKEMSATIIEQVECKPLLHLCNSTGIISFPEYQFDMVRLGIGLYGIDTSKEISNQLQPISTLKTTIAQIKRIPEGDTIGYSRKGIVKRKTKIATICIGYADGFPRILSHNNQAYVMINNQKALIIGNIAMDMCMVDVTEIENVQEGDEVIIFGDSLPIELVASWASTIPYEIMTGIAPRVKRVYINES